MKIKLILSVHITEKQKRHWVFSRSHSSFCFFFPVIVCDFVILLFVEWKEYHKWWWCWILLARLNAPRARLSALKHLYRNCIWLQFWNLQLCIVCDTLFYLFSLYASLSHAHSFILFTRERERNVRTANRFGRIVRDFNVNLFALTYYIKFLIPDVIFICFAL